MARGFVIGDAFTGCLQSTPTVTPPPPKILLSSPGTVQEASVGAGVNVTINVTAAGLSSVWWVVFTKANTAEGAFVQQALNASGTGSFLAHFANTGDYAIAVNDPVTMAIKGVSAAITITDPVTGGTGIALARAFMANLTLGIHAPRGQISALTWNNQALWQSSGYMSYLAGLGFSHLAMSFLWNPGHCQGGYPGSGSTTASVTSSYWTQQIAAAKLANAAGLKTLLRCTDNIDANDYSDVAFFSWLDKCLPNLATSGLDPTMNLICPTAEIVAFALSGNVDNFNSYWNPRVQTMHAKARGYLPQSSGWILGVPGCYWLATSRLTDSTGSRAVVTLPDGTPDQQVVYVCDEYPNHNDLQGSQAGFASNMANWSANHGGGACIILHETSNWNVNDGNTHPSVNSWPNGDFQLVAAGCGKFAPTLWDVSNSDGDQNIAALQAPSTAKFTSGNETAITNANAWIRTQSYYGNGVGR